MVHYRVLVGYFRESPRGSQNLVPPAAGDWCPRLFVTTVIHFRHFLAPRCRTGAGPELGPNLVSFWSHFGPQFDPNLRPNLVPVWSQFGPSLVPVWSQFGPSLVPVWSHFGPLCIPFAGPVRYSCLVVVFMLEGGAVFMFSHWRGKLV